MWERGDYAGMAHDVLTPLGSTLVAACHVEPGAHVLDVATGSGNAAIPAAEAGADVTGSDLSPALLEAARREAAQHGVAVRWVEADAEALPFEDDEFDVVMSCIGAMFAPHHKQTADEMLRVCRPGGTVGMLNWTADGSIAEFFRVFAPYLPPMPTDTTPPLEWGDLGHVGELFGDRLEDMAVAQASLLVDRFGSPEEFREYYKGRFGPTMTAYAQVADDPDRMAALDREFLDYARRTNHPHKDGSTHYGFDYMVVTGHKRSN
jgi:2-polyprenyl-6-hydroxyphenyl methylase/3-demethylubiquinone-9 3-methyltransferase